MKTSSLSRREKLLLGLLSSTLIFSASFSYGAVSQTKVDSIMKMITDGGAKFSDIPVSGQTKSERTQYFEKVDAGLGDAVEMLATVRNNIRSLMGLSPAYTADDIVGSILGGVMNGVGGTSGGNSNGNGTGGTSGGNSNGNGTGGASGANNGSSTGTRWAYHYPIGCPNQANVSPYTIGSSNPKGVFQYATRPYVFTYHDEDTKGQLMFNVKDYKNPADTSLPASCTLGQIWVAAPKADAKITRATDENGGLFLCGFYTCEPPISLPKADDRGCTDDMSVPLMDTFDANDIEGSASRKASDMIDWVLYGRNAGYINPPFRKYNMLVRDDKHFVTRQGRFGIYGAKIPTDEKDANDIEMHGGYNPYNQPTSDAHFDPNIELPPHTMAIKFQATTKGDMDRITYTSQFNLPVDSNFQIAISRCRGSFGAADIGMEHTPEEGKNGLVKVFSWWNYNDLWDYTNSPPYTIHQNASTQFHNFSLGRREGSQRKYATELLQKNEKDTDGWISDGVYYLNIRNIGFGKKSPRPTTGKEGLRFASLTIHHYLFNKDINRDFPGSGGDGCSAWGSLSDGCSDNNTKPVGVVTGPELRCTQVGGVGPYYKVNYYLQTLPEENLVKDTIRENIKGIAGKVAFQRYLTKNEPNPYAALNPTVRYMDVKYAEWAQPAENPVKAYSTSSCN